MIQVDILVIKSKVVKFKVGRMKNIYRWIYKIISNSPVSIPINRNRCRAGPPMPRLRKGRQFLITNEMN